MVEPSTKKVKRGVKKVIMQLYLRPRPPPPSPTHGYLGYPRSGAGGRRGRTLVLAPPCGGRPRALILHHSPHRLLPPDLLLTPRAGVVTSGVRADLRDAGQRVAVRRAAAVGAQPHGVSVGHSLAAHACHTDLGDGHAPQRGVTFYTHLLGLWWWEVGV